jgi:hypothetical protein
MPTVRKTPKGGNKMAKIILRILIAMDLLMQG